jgi:CheY-like chemotaxis protein
MRLLYVVDDDASVGKLLRAIFETEGWEVAQASSGEDCLTMVGATPPDVIVLDQMMPGLTGIETARQLRKDGFDKPIVLFSAYEGPDLQTAVRELDLKPVSKVDTEAVIRIVESLGDAPS